MDYPYLHKQFTSDCRQMFHSLSRAGLRVKKRNTFTRTFPRDYLMADGISNFFTEDVRIGCSQKDKKSPAEIWKETERNPPKGWNLMSPWDRHEHIYEKSKGCNIFNPSLAVYLYMVYAPRLGQLKILDPSAGWGDRLIAALACGHVYHGYDPNSRLDGGYKKIIETFGDSRSRVEIAPFEDAKVEGNYDMVLTSPPYFDLEIYVRPDEDVDKSQSSTRFRLFTDWLEGMYGPYLNKAYSSLKIGGRMIIYIQDIPGYPLAVLTSDIIKLFGGKHVEDGHFVQKFSRHDVSRPYQVWERVAKILTWGTDGKAKNYGNVVGSHVPRHWIKRKMENQGFVGFGGVSSDIDHSVKIDLIEKHKLTSPYGIETTQIDLWIGDGRIEKDGIWFVKPSDGYIGSGKMIQVGDAEKITKISNSLPTSFRVGGSEFPLSRDKWIVQRAIKPPLRDGKAWDVRHFAILVTMNGRAIVYSRSRGVGRMSVKPYDTSDVTSMITNVSINEGLDGYSSEMHLFEVMSPVFTDIVVSTLRGQVKHDKLKPTAMVLGFDSIQDEGNAWHLIEVNASPYMGGGDKGGVEEAEVSLVWKALFDDVYPSLLHGGLPGIIPGWERAVLDA